MYLFCVSPDSFYSVADKCGESIYLSDGKVANIAYYGEDLYGRKCMMTFTYYSTEDIYDELCVASKQFNITKNKTVIVEYHKGSYTDSNPDKVFCVQL